VANGYEDFVFLEAKQNSKALRDTIHDEVPKVWVNANRKNRGIKEANFAVLRETNMPAIILENCFLTNKEDVKLLTNESFQDSLVEAISIGLVKAFDLQKLDKPVMSTLKVSEWAKEAWERAIVMLFVFQKRL